MINNEEHTTSQNDTDGTHSNALPGYDFDIDVRYKNTRSIDGRHEATVWLNGLKYDGLVHEKDKTLHVFIPEINKTFEFTENDLLE